MPGAGGGSHRHTAVRAVPALDTVVKFHGTNRAITLPLVPRAQAGLTAAIFRLLSDLRMTASERYVRERGGRVQGQLFWKGGGN